MVRAQRSRRTGPEEPEWISGLNASGRTGDTVRHDKVCRYQSFTYSPTDALVSCLKKTTLNSSAVECQSTAQ